MSYKSELQSNNTDLQTILNKAKSIESTSVLADEMATQDDLIAQITAALEGKTVPESKKTVSITVTTDIVSVLYFDADGLPQSLYDESATIEALGGIVVIDQNCTITVTGSYVKHAATTYNFYRFASDGGTMTISQSYSGQ